MTNDGRLVSMGSNWGSLTQMAQVACTKSIFPELQQVKRVAPTHNPYLPTLVNTMLPDDLCKGSRCCLLMVAEIDLVYGIYHREKDLFVSYHVKQLQ